MVRGFFFLFFFYILDFVLVSECDDIAEIKSDRKQQSEKCGGDGTQFQKVFPGRHS